MIYSETNSRYKTAIIACCLLLLSVSSYSQITEQHLNDATNVVNGLADLLAPTPQQVQRREEEAAAAKLAAAAAGEEMVKRKGIAERAFQRDYIDKIGTQANNGNEYYRVLMVYGLIYDNEKYCQCDIGYKLPGWQKWMGAAVKNNNIDAMTLVGYSALYSAPKINLDLTVSQGITILERAANQVIPEKGYMGVQVQNITEALAKEKSIDNRTGAYVVSVVPDFAGEEAGMKAGDIISMLDDVATPSADVFLKEIGKHAPGDKIQLTYTRGANEMKTMVTLRKSATKRNTHQDDAMLILANYYNMKKKVNGGEDAEKALHWYAKAAEAGSPNAMYTLGKIYTEGRTVDNPYYVKYTGVVDKEKGFSWYLKSVETTQYNSSLFYRWVKYGSYFEPASYDEIIKMYSKGIGCEKDMAKANEWTAVKDEYLLNQKLSK